MNQKMKRIVVWILLVSLLIGIVPVMALTAFADVPEHSHISDTPGWKYDDSKHWHACTTEGCEEHLDEGEHDTTGSVWEKDSEKHWKTCTTCQARLEEGKHNLQLTAVTETEHTYLYTCTCGWKASNTVEAYTVTTAVTPDGKGTLTADGTTVPVGNTVTLTATPMSGYTLKALTSDDADLEGTGFTMPEKNVAVTAEFALESLTLNQSALDVLYVGQTATLSVSAPTGEAVTWRSDNEAVATVADGIITAVAKGDAVITAAAVSDSDITATCTVHVGELSLTSEAKTISGKKGLPLDTTTLELEIHDGNFASTAEFTAENVCVTGLPAGLSYTVTKNNKKLTLTFSGTPTEAKEGALQITVAKSLIANAPEAVSDPIAVIENANTKWEIKDTHAVTVQAIASAHGSVSLSETRNLYASDETVTVVPSVNAPFEVKSVTVSPTATVTKAAAGYTFPMGDTDVTVTVEIGVKPITSEIAEKSHVDSISLTGAEGLAGAIRAGNSSVKITGTLTDDQKADIEDGRYAFKFTVAKSKSTADNTALRERAVTKDGMHLVYNAYSDLTYFDIKLELTTYKADGTVDGAVIGVTDTGSYKATITFPNLDRSPAKRLYYIHAGHDVKDYLSQSGSSTNGNIVFDNLTQFSTYTLVRTSVESPQTGDHFPLEMLLAAFAVSSMGLIAMVARRKMKE